MRVVLGLSYSGAGYLGWQSQPGGQTVQDRLEAALARFADRPVRTVCAGRTDTGVHALNQVVHFDCDVERQPGSWVRGTNTYLPRDIAVQWCRTVAAETETETETEPEPEPEPEPERAQPSLRGFHARYSARARRYAYVLLESPVRPAVERGQVGWVFRALDAQAMRAAATCLIGEHDFSSFRSSECQAASPVKTLASIDITQRGAYWRFDFEANAYLHHMVRNLMGCLIAVGQGVRSAQWLAHVLEARDRRLAAPTFAPDGLYFLGPLYDADFALPERTAAFDWLV